MYTMYIHVCISDLDGGLRQVVWVPQLSGDIEPEVLGILDGAVTKLDAHGPSLLEGLFQQQRFEDGVQFLPYVLQKDWRAKLDAVFKCADKVRVGELDDMEVFRFLHVFDPLVGLALGVNYERPPASIAAEQSTEINNCSKIYH